MDEISNSAQAADHTIVTKDYKADNLAAEGQPSPTTQAQAKGTNLQCSTWRLMRHSMSDGGLRYEIMVCYCSPNQAWLARVCF